MNCNISDVVGFTLADPLLQNRAMVAWTQQHMAVCGALCVCTMNELLQTSVLDTQVQVRHASNCYLA
jgi:hypothetical protein